MQKVIPHFIVSMTTSPTRIAHIRTTITSVIEQTYKAARIVVNIPEKYGRTGETYTIPDWFKDFESVLFVNHVSEDYGPVTKLFPTVKLVEDAENMYIVTVDDDIKYLPHMLEDFARAIVYNGKREVALGYSGFWFYANYDENISAHLPIGKECHVDILEGYGMVCYKRSFFADDFESYVMTAIRDVETKFSDDLIVSNYLAGRGIKRVQLSNERNSRNTIWSDGCVLELGTKSDALHTGAGGLTTGNNTRYLNACRFLKSQNMLYLSNC